MYRAIQFWIVTFLFVSAVQLEETFDNSTKLNDHQANAEKYQDLRLLSELPMEKLLKVKSSFADFSENEITPTTYKENGGDPISPKSPEALALSTDEEPVRRTDLWSKKGKGGKINTLFMLSVTTLSFLAFGGYLLCLIVQAIKGKGTNYSYNTTLTGTQPVMLMSGSIKKKKPQINYGRKRRDVVEEDPEEMYKVLIMLAEGYAAWEQRQGR